MFVDYANITVKSGNGGDGHISFHREKYVPQGGPDGGDGGRGGNIILYTAPNMRTLMDFKYKKKYFAPDGIKGDARKMRGANGEDLVINVPAGTIVRDKETGSIIIDMFKPGMKYTLLTGGRGGKGNAGFATPTRRAPNFAHPGQKTNEYHIILELKTIADVGLIGFPNVGKSTILSVVSAARPQIANYHFTTLVPNLGVVSYGDFSFMMADIPGLIEGASQGAGLGLNFLKHIERTKLLLHVLDISGSEDRDPLEDFEIINKELTGYSEKLMKRPQIIVANKCDIALNDDNLNRLRKKYGSVYEIYPVSAATTEGFDKLLKRIMEMLGSIPETQAAQSEIQLQQTEDIDENQWTVSRDMDGCALITGKYVENLIDRINFGDVESNRYFHKTLRRLGIIDELRKLGVKDGDTVRVIDIEFEFVD